MAKYYKGITTVAFYWLLKALKDKTTNGLHLKSDVVIDVAYFKLQRQS